jgi:hypothetical protein
VNFMYFAQGKSTCPCKLQSLLVSHRHNMLRYSAVSMVFSKLELLGVDFSSHVVIFYKNIHSGMGSGLACGYFVS